MSSIPASIGEHYTAQLSDHGTASPSSAEWLSSLRQQSLARFIELGFPTPRNEDWKYTRVNAIEKRAFVLPPPALAAAASANAEYTARIEALTLVAKPSARLVFVDGHLQAALSQMPAGNESLAVETLTDVLRDKPETLRGELEQLAASGANGFAFLNSAFSNQGVVVRTGPGARIDAAVEILFVTSGTQEDIACHPQIWLHLEQDSHLTVVENYAGLEAAPTLTNVATQITLNQGAHLSHVKLQNESASAYHVATLNAHVGDHARFDSLSVSLGARLARNEINIRLEGEGAHGGMDGLMLAKNRQHTDAHTRVDHLVPNATSDEYYKGIFDDRSRGVFNGRVYVHAGADGTEAFQQNRNLLLSRNAEIDTKPQLEIYADEVKCSHGATVGQLDENMLFYLRSRGLDKEQATGILIYGFVREVLDRMDDDSLRKRLARHVLQGLPGGDNLGEPDDE